MKPMAEANAVSPLINIAKLQKKMLAAKQSLCLARPAENFRVCKHQISAWLAYQSRAPPAFIVSRGAESSSLYSLYSQDLMGCLVAESNEAGALFP